MYKIKYCFIKKFVTNSLTINVYKTFKCDNNQMPYCNVQGSKNWDLKKKRLSIDKTWSRLDKFYYYYFYLVKK
jgi:hypothetical protein